MSTNTPNTTPSKGRASGTHDLPAAAALASRWEETYEPVLDLQPSLVRLFGPLPAVDEAVFARWAFLPRTNEAKSGDYDPPLLSRQRIVTDHREVVEVLRRSLSELARMSWLLDLRVALHEQCGRDPGWREDAAPDRIDEFRELGYVVSLPGLVVPERDPCAAILRVPRVWTEPRVAEPRSRVGDADVLGDPRKRFEVLRVLFGAHLVPLTRLGRLNVLVERLAEDEAGEWIDARNALAPVLDHVGRGIGLYFALSLLSGDEGKMTEVAEGSVERLDATFHALAQVLRALAASEGDPRWAVEARALLEAPHTLDATHRTCLLETLDGDTRKRWLDARPEAPKDDLAGALFLIERAVRSGRSTDALVHLSPETLRLLADLPTPWDPAGILMAFALHRKAARSPSTLRARLGAVFAVTRDALGPTVWEKALHRRAPDVGFGADVGDMSLPDPADVRAWLEEADPGMDLLLPGSTPATL